MKNEPAFRPNSLFTTLSAGLAALALTVLPGISLRADQSATTLRLTNTGRNTEALPTFRLDWDATSNATYLVQSATDLAPGATWTTLDAVFPTDKAGTYQFQVTATDSTGLASPPATFYRLVLPQPQISSVEPAIVAPGGTNVLYVLGQCFPTNAVLQINGVTPAGASVVSSSLATVPGFVPDAPGTYRVSLVISGQVASAFNVVCADALANPELVLQGPPTIEPPASPQVATLIAAYLSKRGYDYYKAKSDLSAAGAVTNPYFKNNEMAGDMPGAFARPPETGKGIGERGLKLFDDSLAAGFSAPPDSGKGINKPGIKRGIDPVSAAFETQEGKKGLNAVNVKLASRVAGGGDDCDDSDPIFMSAHKEFKGHVSLLKRGDAGVSLFSGEVEACVVDMAIPGRELDFVWARTYHSRLGRFDDSANGWTFSYDVRCAQNSSGGIDVFDGTGRKDTFTLGTNGTYTCPELFREGTISNTTFTVTFADTGRWVFNPFDGTATAGLVHQVITRNGSVITLSHNATSGRLEQVVDDLGRTNTITCDTSGRVTSVTDFSGRTVRYEYDGNGDLVACVSPPVLDTPNGNDFPYGKTNRYTYTSGLALARQNHLLLSCVDALGQTTAQFTYDLSVASVSYLRCTTVQEGANPPTVCSYAHQVHLPWYSGTKCTVNDPVGNVTECDFDSRGRCVVERDYTGRATPGTPVTDTQNRPTGKLRDSDPDYYETQWMWNNDSLCTSEISPGGQQLRCVYQSDFDPATPARKRADCRVVREIASSPVDLDGDGVADVTERACHYSYDPRFGSDPSSSALRESPTKQTWGIRESPSKQSLGVVGGGGSDAGALGKEKKRPGRESPTLPSKGKATVRESPTLASLGQTALRESPSKASLGRTALRESPTLPSKGKGLAKLRESPTKQSCGFCISATDPRGNVTTASYDQNGNTKKSSGGVFEIEDYHFDSSGQLISVTNAPDANGHRRVDTFAWSQGQLTQCVVDAGAGGLAITSSFEYDARGNLARCVDPRGNDCLFTYNALDQCVRVQSPPNISARCATDFAYDANDNIVSCTTEVRGAVDNLAGTNIDRLTYDSLQRLTECALAVDPSHVITNRFVYDANDQCVQVLGPDAVSGADPHQRTTFEYDERGLLFHATTAPGSTLASTRQFDYSPSGKIKRFNVELYVEEMSFDGFDRPSVGTDPMGNQTVCFFDANDNLKVVRQFGELNDVAGTNGNVRLAESRYEYDGLGRLYKVHALHFGSTQSPVGDGEATTTLTYAPNGDCTSVTDDLGLVTTFGYDTAGRSTSAISSGAIAGIVIGVVVARDACGNVTSVTETNTSTSGGPAQVFACTYVYDSLSRLVSCTDSAGNTSSCAYDSLGHVVRATDALGNDTTCAYDFMGDCLTSVSYAGSSSLQSPVVVRSSSAIYDQNLRCASATDANGNTTSYAYDTLGNCTLVTRPDGTHQQLVWSPRSNLLQATDPNGTVSVCTYDLNDRLVRRDITMGGGGAGGSVYYESFTFDGCDRLTGAANDGSTCAFAYDSLDNCVSETLNGLTTTSTYDALGNRHSLAYPGGRVLTYAYDTASRCTGITESGATLASFDYTGLRLSKETCGNGVSSQVAYDGLVSPPNAQGDHGFGQVSQVRHTLANGSVVLSGCKATWDQKQNKTARTVAIPGAGGHTNAMTFAYDAVDQLVQSVVMDGTTLLRTNAYGFDRMGNRTNVTGAASCSGAYTMDGSVLAGLFDFQMNQYTTTPCDSRAYDDNGNLLGRFSPTSMVTYQYDYANRLVAVMDASAGTQASYTYDAFGRRVSKTVTSGTLGTTTRQYCYDGTCAIEERQNGAVAASFVLEDRALIGLRLGTQDYFVHTDDQGNTLALTGANGSVVERYNYDDYGAVTFLTSDGFPTSATSSIVGNPYCWGGLRLDAETGLHNDDGGDYFDPQAGRAVRGKVKTVKDMGHGVCADDLTGNNPWSSGGGGGVVEMQKGTVKFFNEAKGFGFIKAEEGQAVAKHYITIPHNLQSKVKALGANGEGKKEFVGHVSLLK